MNGIRVSRALLVVGLLIALVLPLAQASAESDPAGRVARMNYFSGTVTFAPAGSEEWAGIQVNRPLISGDRIWIDQDGRSEMHIGSTVVRLDGQSSLSFLRLDDDTAQMKLTEGTLNLHVRTLSSGQVYEVDTPNLAFSVQSPGTYRIDVSPDGDMTTVTVRHGSGTAYGAASSTTLSDGQQLSFTGTELQMVSSAGNPPFDDFDTWANERDRVEDTATAARYVSRDVIGYEDLDAWGSWRSTPQYGMVWEPRVTMADWAPYRTGHWAWISPWGWTWVDDAPWGFAPYHYGRWAYIDRAWCWVPGQIVTVRPVYAPALVAFVGGSGSGVGFSLSFGGATVPAVGWLPLGPGEIYRPAYAVSQTYIRNINKTVILNNTTINHVTVNKTVYVNRTAPHAITAVPASVFAKGAPVTPVAKAVAPQFVKDVAGIRSAPPVAAPAHGFADITRRAEPPAARGVFERPVVAASPAPGHRTVRAALAGRAMPTVEPREKIRENRPGGPGNIANTPPNTPRLPAGQMVIVPQPAYNMRERQIAPSRSEPRIERENVPHPHGVIPHPPGDAVDRPVVSHGHPFRGTVPQQEQRQAPAATISRALPTVPSSPQPSSPQEWHRDAPHGEHRHADAPPGQHREQVPQDVHARPQGEARQERRHPHEKAGEHQMHAPV
jgi:hypothetical protein